MGAPLPALSPDDKKIIFDTLDTIMNSLILGVLLYGLYTGIIAITLWTIFTSTKRSQGTFLRTIIIMLYVLLTITFLEEWAFAHHAFIQHGDNYYTVFRAMADFSPWWEVNQIVGAITGGITMLLADIAIIWRCWTLWDHQWRVVFIPMLCTTATVVLRIMHLVTAFQVTVAGNTGSWHKIRFIWEIDWLLAYTSLTVATTLICTLLILYRIIRLAQRIFLFRNIIAAVIESSLIYTLTHILLLITVARHALEATNDAAMIATYGRAIPPTLLALRVASRSDSSYSGDSTSSTAISDLNFGPMDENPSSDSPIDQNFSGSHEIRSTESV
ncbi:hypothetical protein EDD85DRAFT_979883 [Armillaria nabsnona]|nr:hypothetical protein EDD85DRAFT_979883 [Armillaria nabsnona]